MTDLKSCPLCDAPAHSWHIGDNWGIECESCGCRISGYGSRREAVKRWNTRLGETKARAKGFREAMWVHFHTRVDE